MNIINALTPKTRQISGILFALTGVTLKKEIYSFIGGLIYGIGISLLVKHLHISKTIIKTNSNNEQFT